MPGLLNPIAIRSDDVDCGEKWEPDDYKCAFLKAMGVKCRISAFARRQGRGGGRLSVLEAFHHGRAFSELIEMIHEYGTPETASAFHGWARRA